MWRSSTLLGCSRQTSQIISSHRQWESVWICLIQALTWSFWSLTLISVRQKMKSVWRRCWMLSLNGIFNTPWCSAPKRPMKPMTSNRNSFRNASTDTSVFRGAVLLMTFCRCLRTSYKWMLVTWFALKVHSISQQTHRPERDVSVIICDVSSDKLTTIIISYTVDSLDFV